VPNATAWTLSGFADEIGPDPVVQLAVLAALGARHLEVRSAWGTNVADLDDEALTRLRTLCDERGFAVSALGSPVGKASLHDPADVELARLDRVLHAAEVLGTRYVRIFSFWTEGAAPRTVRDEVLRRLREFARSAAVRDVVLLHENEKEIYGDVPERVAEIVEEVGSPALKVAWDSANFVQVGVKPFSEGFALLRPHLEYLQVKDARSADGTVVPAGEGDGEVEQTLRALRDDGWTGFASLEPHLATHPADGPAQFGRAARAFRGLTDALGVELR
jgi:sugar phosphate isomerase/epimerase